MGKGTGPTFLPTGKKVKVHPGSASKEAEEEDDAGEEKEMPVSPAKMSRKDRAKMKYQSKREGGGGEMDGVEEKDDWEGNGGAEETKGEDSAVETAASAFEGQGRLATITRAAGNWSKLKAAARVIHDYEFAIEHHKLSHVTRDLFQYMSFLSLFLVVVFLGKTTEPFFMIQTMEDYITTNEYSPGSSFYTIKNNIEVFAWMDNVFLPVMMPTSSGTAGYDLSCEEQQYMGDGLVNRRVGAIRLRQLRIQKDTCTIPGMFEKATDRCFGVWSTDSFGHPSSGIEETGQRFGTKWLNKAVSGTETAWSNKGEVLAGGAYKSSSTGILYPGTGYLEPLPNNREAASKRLRQLFRGTWLDYQARALFIEFLVYNTASNNLVTCRLFIEYGPEGDMFTDASFHVSETYNQYLVMNGDRSGNWYILVGGYLEVGLYIFALWQVFQELLIFWNVKDKAGKKREEAKEDPTNVDYQPAHQELDIWNLISNKTDSAPWELEYRQTLQRHLFDVYNMLQYVNLSLFGATFVCRVFAYGAFQKVREQLEYQINAPCQFNNDGCGGTGEDWTLLDDNGDPVYKYDTKFGYCTPEFTSMFDCEYYEVYFRKFIAINALLLFIKFFRYVRFYHKFAVVIETAKAAAASMTTLVFVIIIVLFGFAVSFHVAFGYRSDSFKEISECLITLIWFTLGEFDGQLDNLRGINPTFGPIFFILFVAVMVFVIMSMFFALTANAYEGVQESLANQLGETEEMTAVLDDIVFIADYIRRKLPCGVGKRIMPDAHALSERLSHRPSWIPDDDMDHPVPSKRLSVMEGNVEDDEAPETENEALDRMGFEGAEREFVVSMQTPKHSMLKHLVAFEEQQRDMLHAIEALNKRAREMAIAKELELNERRKNMARPGPAGGGGGAEADDYGLVDMDAEESLPLR